MGKKPGCVRDKTTEKQAQRREAGPGVHVTEKQVPLQG